MNFDNDKAVVSHLPGFSGDGYGYGGGTVLTIGSRSLLLGEGEAANELAWEIANRWNASPVSSPDRDGK